MQPFELRDEIALITGGGSGIGLAIGRCMTAAGAKVMLVGRRKAPLAEAAEAIGDQARWLTHDVTDLAAADDLIARTREALGDPTILVNNAGIHLKKPAETVGDAEFARVVATHLFGAHALCRAAAPAMLARGHGSILFISSMAALYGLPQAAAYAAAKSALTGLLYTLAVEWSPRGVRVNAIAPGWIATEMVRRNVDSDPERKARVLARTPMGTFGTPDDVGTAAVYLASPAARFVTGALLPVDGGVRIGF